jgi:RNA polymerase sigma factor for flagellar operon FliA
VKRRGAPCGLDLVVRPPRVEASWWRRWRFEAQLECRESLFRHYTPLARTIALRHFKRRAFGRVDRCDFDHFAYEGLLRALDRFDPLRGVPFDAYARSRIQGSIADGVGSMNEVNTQLSQRRRAEQERLRSLRSEGLEAEDALGALAQLVGGLAVGLMLESSSLMASEDKSDPSPSAYDTLESRQLAAMIAAEVGKLPKAEAEVIAHHYQTGLSFAQVADLLGLSRGRVSQLHHAGLKRLRKRLGMWR